MVEEGWAGCGFQNGGVWGPRANWMPHILPQKLLSCELWLFRWLKKRHSEDDQLHPSALVVSLLPWSSNQETSGGEKPPRKEVKGVFGESHRMVNVEEGSLKFPEESNIRRAAEGGEAPGWIQSTEEHKSWQKAWGKRGGSKT